MGGKNSGRYKKGFKNKQVLKSKPTPIVEKTVEPSIEIAEETLDFESNADRILKETTAGIESEKAKAESQKTETNENIKVDPQPEQPKPKKEDWSPVVGFFMGVMGQIFEGSTGFKEMNYTEQEIERCSEAGSEIINVLWPNVQALTEEQKILILNSMIILKVHVDKISLLKELKAKKLDETKVERSNEKTVEAETKSAA